MHGVWTDAASISGSKNFLGMPFPCGISSGLGFACRMKTGRSVPWIIAATTAMTTGPWSAGSCHMTSTVSVTASENVARAPVQGADIARATARMPGRSGGLVVLRPETPVETLVLFPHLAQKVRRLEARAKAFRELVAPFGGIGRPDDIEPAKRPPGPRREAPAEDRTHVALADIFKHAVLERADGFEH